MNRSLLNSINLLLLLPICFFASNLIADSSAPIRSPEFIDGAKLVDSEKLIQLVNSFDELMVIDSRLETNRSFGYIDGSISLPDTKTSCETLAGILSDKDHPALFYCNGPKCGRSAVAIEIALKCGYTELYWFRGGIEEWRQKGFPLVN